MLKITKLTDYALVVLCCLVKQKANILNTTEIAKQVSIQVPTVSKILKILVKSGLVESYRGSEGGYRLFKNPNEISISQIIEILEGPIAITSCATKATASSCEFINNCQLSRPWQKINLHVNNMLQKISLYDIAVNNIEF